MRHGRERFRAILTGLKSRLAPCLGVESAASCAVEKKRLRQLNALAEKLKALPDLDEAERVLYAHSLLATPQERWNRHESFLRSSNLFSYFERKKFGFKSSE